MAQDLPKAVGGDLGADLATDNPFAAAIRSTRMSMIITRADDDQPIIFANDSFLKLTGYERDDLIGRNCRLLQGSDTDPAAVAQIRDAVREGRSITLDILNYRRDGEPFWNSLSLSPVSDSEGRITYFFGSQFDITEKKLAELELIRTRDGLADEAQNNDRNARIAQAQARALLHEVDHRVKNNLQLISSLMLLQSRRIQDPSAREALRGMLDRVGAIATVHRRLFQGDDIERFDVAQFLRDLAGDLAGSGAAADQDIRLDVERVDVSAAQAAPLALIVNELLCNALRHGRPRDGRGAVDVTVQRENGHYRIEVRDHGDRDVDPAGFVQGFGMTIVNLLSRQLGATTTLNPAQPGVRATVVLPKPSYPTP